jgi:hypothetical protein
VTHAVSEDMVARTRKSTSELVPAWQDDDDNNVSINVLGEGHTRLRKLRTSRNEYATTAMSGSELQSRLRQRFETMVQNGLARTDWAHIELRRNTNDDDAVSGEEENVNASSDVMIESTTASYLDVSASNTHHLPPNRIRMVRCPDLNQNEPHNATIQVIHFHPGSDSETPLALVAGLDKTLRFYQVGSKGSTKVHGIHCTYSTVFA